MLAIGPVAAADWEIRAASWQLAAMLEASSSKRIYDGNRKKEEGESSLHLFHLTIKTSNVQHNWCWDRVNQKKAQRVLSIYTNQTLFSLLLNGRWLTVSQCQENWRRKNGWRKGLWERFGLTGEEAGANGFNKAVTLQKRMSSFHGPVEWD